MGEDQKKYIFQVLEEAGFSRIAIEGLEKNIDWYSGLSVAQAVDNFFRTSPAAAEKLASADATSQALIRNELEAAYADYYRDECITFPAAVWIVSAFSS